MMDRLTSPREQSRAARSDSLAWLLLSTLHSDVANDPVLPRLRRNAREGRETRNPTICEGFSRRYHLPRKQKRNYSGNAPENSVDSDIFTNGEILTDKCLSRTRGFAWAPRNCTISKWEFCGDAHVGKLKSRLFTIRKCSRSFLFRKSVLRIFFSHRKKDE